MTPPSFSAKIPVLVGPTGVGKSEVAFELAQKWGAEIISADAYQVYRGLPIGTAQPSLSDQQKVPHHLVGSIDFSTPWSAAQFAKKAADIIKDLQARGQKALLVGGAGFYLKALVEGIPVGEAPSDELRSWIEAKMAELGPGASRQWLLERDPQAAGRIHENDLYRMGRALEKSYGASAPAPAPIFNPSHFRFYGLERDRNQLDSRLRDRIKKMWTGGLREEVEFLKQSGVDLEHPVWAAIGYQEAEAFRSGKWTEEEALEKMFRRTRQYAKRQWTWFKHQHSVQWLSLDKMGSSVEAAAVILKELTKS